MDLERMALLKRIGVKGIHFKEAFEALYESYKLQKKSLSETLRQSPIHSNPALEAPESIDTRYLNEDIPFGLAPWASLGRRWDVPTPHIEAMIRIASTMLGKDYFNEGLSVEDLGMGDIPPEDVCACAD